MKHELMDKGFLVRYPFCYMIRQSMPYPLATSNSYLVEVDNGWAVIDVGVDLPTTRELWQSVLSALGLTWSHIKVIYITHCHPDHLGAAAWMQRRSEAPVYILDQELERAHRFIFLGDNYVDSYLKVTGDEMSRQGFDKNKRLRLAADWEAQVQPLYPKPEWVVPLSVNQKISLQGLDFRVAALPGHTDGQAGFWSQEAGIMFSADLVAAEGGYLHFSDWPNTNNENPLGDLLTVIEKVKEWKVKELLPGHGGRIEKPEDIFERLKKRHFKQLDLVLKAVKKPCCAAELYQEMLRIPDEEYIHYHRVSLGEALGYLLYLEADGQVRSYKENGVLQFIKV